MYLCAKFQVSSFTGFGDMFEGVPNFIRVMWPKPRPFSEILFVHFREIVHMHPYAKFQVCGFICFGRYVWGCAKFYKLHVIQAMTLYWNFIYLFWRNCSYASACQISSHRQTRTAQLQILAKRGWPMSHDPYKIWHSLKHISNTRFGDMFEGVPNFIRATWHRPPPLSQNL